MATLPPPRRYCEPGRSDCMHHQLHHRRKRRRMKPARPPPWCWNPVRGRRLGALLRHRREGQPLTWCFRRCGMATGCRRCVEHHMLGVTAALKHGRSCDGPPTLRWSTAAPVLQHRRPSPMELRRAAGAAMEHRRADVTVAMNHGRSFGRPPALHWSTTRQCRGCNGAPPELGWSTAGAALEHHRSCDGAPRAGVAAAMEHRVPVSRLQWSTTGAMMEHRRAGVGTAMEHRRAAVAAERPAQPTGVRLLPSLSYS